MSASVVSRHILSSCYSQLQMLNMCSYLRASTASPSCEPVSGTDCLPKHWQKMLRVLQATQDTRYLDAGAAIIQSLYELNWVDGGWASLQSVHTRKLEDAMPSYFLAEACKYLYLLFDDSFLQVSSHQSLLLMLDLTLHASQAATPAHDRGLCSHNETCMLRILWSADTVADECRHLSD